MILKITMLSISFLLLTPKTSYSQDLSEIASYLNGATILAQDDQNTFLGSLTNEYNSNSIFNEYGTYGNEYNSDCIWNEYGTFGGEYNTYSPFNEYSSNPPMIIKNGKIIAYLTVNKSIKGAISPNLLKAIKDQFY